MSVIKMENEQMEQLQWETQQSEVKKELLSSIGLFIGTGLLGFWLGLELLQAVRWLTDWKSL